MSTLDRLRHAVAVNSIASQRAMQRWRGADTTWSDLELDSLDLVELRHAAEDEFQVDLADEEIDEIATVGALAALIDCKLTTKAAMEQGQGP